ncbi:MAG: tRNA 2-thiouridine(34) synthase MnmA [Desulfobulbaceae bacterium]|nr:tRNA 2-thiouridine(34) synthase MnmA [Desulfobulbaceae bacterium]
MPALKVGIAMSGGVDSTIAASLLRDQGFAVHGFFMILPLPNLARQLLRVQEVAANLSIPLELIDLRQQFSEQIIGTFINGYLAGQTPNPCVQCNQSIKFGAFAQAMLNAGMNKVATGHYARVQRSGDDCYIARGVDRVKDQSYFLAQLSSAKLQSVLFPLGDWTKAQVYPHAQALGFQFQGEESQDVCFLSQGLSAFLAQHGVQESIGPIVALDGTLLGEHQGIWNYTIGQRRGLGLPDATPWYVVGLDGPGNRVVVGKNSDLQQSACTVHSLRWTPTLPPFPWRGQVQLRSRHTPALGELRPFGPTCWQIIFDIPQRAITPGQYAVFYDDDRVVGSALIAAPGSITGAVAS